MTALAPVRAELDEIERKANASFILDVGAIKATARIRSVIDRIHPEPDVLAALGVVALGMVRELKESEQIGICAQRIEGGPQAYESWHKRAEEILAAAYPDSHWAKELALKQNARRSP